MSLPDGLWGYLVSICGTILDFYSLEKTEYNVDNDVVFFLELLKNEEKSINEFRNKFQIYIENNGGKFKELTSFPEYFYPRDKKINNFEADKIRATLYLEKDKTKRAELIEELNKIKEEDNPDYQPLTKIEEAEHCLFWAIHSCRYEFKNDHLNDLLGLPKATFLYGVACGLLGLDVFGTYHKLNEEKTAQQQGGESTKLRSEAQWKKIYYLWDNQHVIEGMFTTYANFSKYIISNIDLLHEQGHLDKNDMPSMDYPYIAKRVSAYDRQPKKSKG